MILIFKWKCLVWVISKIFQGRDSDYLRLLREIANHVSHFEMNVSFNNVYINIHTILFMGYNWLRNLNLKRIHEKFSYKSNIERYDYKYCVFSFVRVLLAAYLKFMFWLIAQINVAKKSALYLHTKAVITPVSTLCHYVPWPCIKGPNVYIFSTWPLP